MEYDRSKMIEYQRSYVSLMNLAKERREHFTRTKNELETCGVELAFPANVVGARFYWNENIINRCTSSSHLLSGSNNAEGFVE